MIVQVKAVGINPVDTYIRSGNYAIKKELPFTPGMDSSGILLQVGSQVKTFRRVSVFIPLVPLAPMPSRLCLAGGSSSAR